MTQSLFRYERGTHVVAENTTVGVMRLFGTGAPPGTSGDTDAAEIGSIYQNDSDGSFWIKVTSTSQASDWKKLARQEDLDAVSGGATGTVTGVTTLQDIDATCTVDDCNGTEWEIVCWEEATPGNIQMLKLTALHNGQDVADASATDESIHTKLKIGSAFNAEFYVALSGTGGSQVMKLQASSSTAGVTVKYRRTNIP